MRIVIVGSGGRLGAALARSCATEHEVYGFRHADLDLMSVSQIRNALEPLSFDALINCAALTNVDYCETHEAEAMRINAEAIGDIARICSVKRARCLHISTDYVFDGEQREPYAERDAARPISIYGESKKRGEDELLAVSERHLAVRVAWVFGSDRPSFIDAILKRSMESDLLEAVDDKWSAPTFTKDACGWVMTLLADDQHAGIIHACNTGACTWREYGEYAVRCAADAGAPVKTRTVKGLRLAEMQNFVAKRPVYTVLSTSRLASALATAPRSWQSAVEDYVRNYFVPSLH